MISYDKDAINLYMQIGLHLKEEKGGEIERLKPRISPDMATNQLCVTD